jgi:preprotein translocase subunit YajC
MITITIIDRILLIIKFSLFYVIFIISTFFPILPPSNNLTKVANATVMMSYLFQTVSSSGELGTITNVIEQSLILAINDNTAQLELLLGQPLPEVWFI